MAAIELREVSYSYGPRASRPAVNRLTVSLPPGITGIVGPNGAGKSTLLRLIAAMRMPGSGYVLIDGLPADHARIAGRIGLIPETPLFEDYLTAADFLGGLAEFAGQRRELAPTFPSELAGISLGSLSLGQKRRIEIAAALTGDPAVILLDEPTNGLDPFALMHLREQVQTLNDGNRALIISSHHLDELQRLADRVVVMAEGRLLGCWDREQTVREFGTVENLFHQLVRDLAPRVEI